MTLVLSWVSRAQKKISSVYIATDSRISQGNKYWDSAKKVFASKTQPLIFGYCGDVLIPSTLLAELVDSIDANFLFRHTDPPKEKWKIIQNFLQNGLQNSLPFLSKNQTEIYALHRIGSENFFAAHYVIAGENVNFEEAEIYSEKTKSLKVMGSGKEYFNYEFTKTKQHNSGCDAARIYFASFCRTVESDKVTTIGGPPQLATLRTNGFGEILPIKFHNTLWFQGVKTEPGNYPGEAFDETFQRINPRTLNIVDGAQKQPLNK